MSLRSRIAKLEGSTPGEDGVKIIFRKYVAPGKEGEIRQAAIVGGPRITRDGNESENEFVSRVEALQKQVEAGQVP